MLQRSLIVLSELSFFGGVLIASFFVIQFNVKVNRLIAAVQIAYARNGKDWKFWADLKRIGSLLRDQKGFIKSDDSPEICVAKQALLNQWCDRKRMRARAITSALLGFLACIGLLVLAASAS